MQGKIFGIGLSKTGTSSLAQALQRLGYKTKDCMGASRYVPGDLSSLDMDTVLAHDALTDTPIPSFYRELDASFPGSKFILTVRDRQGWLQSCRKQFNEKSAATRSEAHRRLFEDLYGTDVFDESRFVAGYERFVAGVYEHFKHRPDDLLVLDVAAGDGWDKLCPFLGRPVPDLPFPKANVTQIRWIDIEDLVSIAQAAGQELLKRWSGAMGPAAGFRAAAGLLRRAIGTASSSDAAAATKAAYKVIEAGLQKRSPGTPVVGPGGAVAPYGERKRWNHLWLVDPLDGVAAFEQGSSDFTVNIALIEDGVAMYGVVHSPARGTTYFGRLGKGAFSRSAGGGPVRLGAAPDATEMPVAERDAADAGLAGSHALLLCDRMARGVEWRIDAPADEWRVAAAHAVIGASGAWALTGPEGVEPVYNSERLQVPAHRLGRVGVA